MEADNKSVATLESRVLVKARLTERGEATPLFGLEQTTVLSFAYLRRLRFPIAGKTEGAAEQAIQLLSRTLTRYDLVNEENIQETHGMIG